MAGVAVLPVAVVRRVVVAEEPHDHLERAPVHPVQRHDERIGPLGVEVGRHVDGHLGHPSVEGRAQRAPHGAGAPGDGGGIGRRGRPEVGVALLLERRGLSASSSRASSAERFDVAVAAGHEARQPVGEVLDGLRRRRRRARAARQPRSSGRARRRRGRAASARRPRAPPCGGKKGRSSSRPATSTCSAKSPSSTSPAAIVGSTMVSGATPRGRPRRLLRRRRRRGQGRGAALGGDRHERRTWTPSETPTGAPPGKRTTTLPR